MALKLRNPGVIVACSLGSRGRPRVSSIEKVARRRRRENFQGSWKEGNLLKMRLKFHFVLLAWFFSVGDVSAAQLWQNTSSGMSVAQIRSLYPSIHGPSIQDNAEIYCLDNVKIMDENFSACFKFKFDKLEYVSLSEDDAMYNMDPKHYPAPFTARDASITYGLLKDELFRRYGPTAETFGLFGPRLEFEYNGTKITLSYRDNRITHRNEWPLDKSIMIVYMALPAADAPL